MQNKERRPRLVIGTFIILMGVLSLVQNMLVQDVAAWLWIAGMALSALIFGWAFTYEKEAWSAVGTYVTAAIALLILLVTQIKLADQWVPVVVLLGIALPFVVGWWVDRQKWGLLIPAYVMLAIIPVLFLEETVPSQSEVMPAYVLFAVALPFLVAYIVTRKLGLLVPGGVLLLLSIAFFGVSFGLPSQTLTVLIPLVLIVSGLYLLFRTGSGELKQQQ
jgi:MFS family permease